MSKKTQTTTKQDRTAKPLPVRMKRRKVITKTIPAEVVMDIYLNYFRSFGFDV